MYRYYKVITMEDVEAGRVPKIGDVLKADDLTGEIKVVEHLRLLPLESVALVYDLESEKPADPIRGVRSARVVGQVDNAQLWAEGIVLSGTHRITGPSQEKTWLVARNASVIVDAAHVHAYGNAQVEVREGSTAHVEAEGNAFVCARGGHVVAMENARVSAENHADHGPLVTAEAYQNAFVVAAGRVRVDAHALHPDDRVVVRAFGIGTHVVVNGHVTVHAGGHALVEIRGGEPRLTVADQAIVVDRRTKKVQKVTP